MERYYYKQFKNIEGYNKYLCPSLFCSLFGLIQIQKRCDEVVDYSKVDSFITNNFNDIKLQNLGLLGNTIVVVDYESFSNKK